MDRLKMYNCHLLCTHHRVYAYKVYIICYFFHFIYIKLRIVLITKIVKKFLWSFLFLFLLYQFKTLIFSIRQMNIFAFPHILIETFCSFDRKVLKKYFVKIRREMRWCFLILFNSIRKSRALLYCEDQRLSHYFVENKIYI